MVTRNFLTFVHNWDPRDPIVHLTLQQESVYCISVNWSSSAAQLAHDSWKLLKCWKSSCGNRPGFLYNGWKRCRRDRLHDFSLLGQQCDHQRHQLFSSRLRQDYTLPTPFSSVYQENSLLHKSWPFDTSPVFIHYLHLQESQRNGFTWKNLGPLGDQRLWNEASFLVTGHLHGNDSYWAWV